MNPEDPVRGRKANGSPKTDKPQGKLAELEQALDARYDELGRALRFWRRNVGDASLNAALAAAYDRREDALLAIAEEEERLEQLAAAGADPESADAPS